MDIKIDKFKLIAGGMGGMEIWRTEPVRKNDVVTLDRVHRKRDVPIDKPLREKVQKLKYFYLLLTRHYMSPFDKYMDHENKSPLPIKDMDSIPQGQLLLKHLWNDTAITGVSMKDDGFVITGSIESLDGKKIGISTPYVTAEDDYAFYSEAIDFIHEISREINKYLYSNLLPLHDAREKYMLENDLKSLTKEDEDKLTEMLIDRLHEKGAIVIMGSDENIPDALAPVGRESEDLVVHHSRNNLTHGRFDDGQQEDDDGQIIFGENKGKVPNDFAAPSDSMQPENLAEMESSDNMLIEDDDMS